MTTNQDRARDEIVSALQSLLEKQILDQHQYIELYDILEDNLEYIYSEEFNNFWKDKEALAQNNN